MTLPRSQQIIPGQPGFYHCISRCVRRAWLCGDDPLTARNYDYRRQWIVERLHTLSACFAVDIYAYSVMSNHTHLVLHVEPDRIDQLKDAEVIRRYKTVWNWRNPAKPLKLPTAVPKKTLKSWRKRLGDVSWFMRLLNEPIARMANAEDNCKGHFWESRFKSIPILDEAGLLTCMTYVDLNPIKAGVAQTLEDCDYTSIQHRVLALIDAAKAKANAPLAPVMTDPSPRKGLRKKAGKRTGRKRNAVKDSVGIITRRYIELVQRTAENLLADEPELEHAELECLEMAPEGWVTVATDFLTLFRSAAGGYAAFEKFMERTGRTRRQDLLGRKLLFTD